MLVTILELIAVILVVISWILAILIIVENHKPRKEQVNHPSHYKKNGKECIECMEEEFGPLAVYHFCLLNAFKYKWRAGYKDDNSYKQDLAKAKWYEDYDKKLIDKGIAVP